MRHGRGAADAPTRTRRPRAPADNASRHRDASTIDAGVVDADEVHLCGGADHLVVADQLGACPLLGADEATLDAETQTVAVEIDDMHGRS